MYTVLLCRNGSNTISSLPASACWMSAEAAETTGGKSMSATVDTGRDEEHMLQVLEPKIVLIVAAFLVLRSLAELWCTKPLATSKSTATYNSKACDHRCRLIRMSVRRYIRSFSAMRMQCNNVMHTTTVVVVKVVVFPPRTRNTKCGGIVYSRTEF